MGGSWFTAPGESSAEAFMRRLKKSDPAYAIYQAYAEEHAERWAEAKELSVAEATTQMPEIERKYQLELAEYDNVTFGLSDEFAAASKLEQEKLTKLSDSSELQGLLDSGAYVAVNAATGAVVKDSA